MVMNGFDTNFDLANEVYAVNTVGFHYAQEPIRVKRGELVRIYLVNILEFDQINSFHVHANFFHYFPTGTSLQPVEFTDTIVLGPGAARDPRAALPLHGQVHVPRAQDRVRRPRLDGLLRGGGVTSTPVEAPERRSLRTPLLGLLPLVLVAAAVSLFALLGAPGLGDRRGPPVEELVFERTVLRPGEIELTVRNDGPDPVRDLAGRRERRLRRLSRRERGDRPPPRRELTIAYPWIEGEAYEVSLLTSTGATIAHEIPAAVETPSAGTGFYGLMTLLGVYVGVLPIALGMLWLPFMRRLRPAAVRFIMAVTLGLLVFLAVDATLEGLEVAGQGSQALGESRSSSSARSSPTSCSPRSTRTCARGAARPRRGARTSRCWSRSASGCTTWGRGSPSAPRTRSARSRWARCSSSASRSTTRPRGSRSSRRSRRNGRRWRASRCSASSPGAPAIVGAWIGAAAFHPSVSAFLLGFGAGAIVQVVQQLAPLIRNDDGRHLYPASAAGLVLGIGILYVTGLLAGV